MLIGTVNIVPSDETTESIVEPSKSQQEGVAAVSKQKPLLSKK